MNRQRPLIIGMEAFHEHRLYEFWSYVVERHRIWKCREEGKPWPWSTDYIFQTQFFCNVYRALDPTTRWLRRNVLEWDTDPTNQLFNVLAYRLIGREETFDRIGVLQVDEYDDSWFLTQLQKYQRETGQQPLSRHAMAGKNSRGGARTRLHQVVETVGKCAKEMEMLSKNLLGPNQDVKRAYLCLRRRIGWGKGNAYQAVMDLLTPQSYRQGQSMMCHPKAINDWAPISSLELKEVVELLSVCVEEEEQEKFMRTLWQTHATAIYSLDETFQFLPDGEGSRYFLTLGDIHGCLQEYQRYWRTKLAFRGPRKSYFPPHLRSKATEK